MKHIINHINESRGIVTGGGDWSDLCDLIDILIDHINYIPKEIKISRNEVINDPDIFHMSSLSNNGTFQKFTNNWNKIFPYWINEIILRNDAYYDLLDGVDMGYDTDSKLIGGKLNPIIYLKEKCYDLYDFRIFDISLSHELRHAYDDYICRTQRGINFNDVYDQTYIHRKTPFRTTFNRRGLWVIEVIDFLCKKTRSYPIINLSEFLIFLIELDEFSYFLIESENNAMLREFYEKIKITSEEIVKFSKETETYYFHNKNGILSHEMSKNIDFINDILLPDNDNKTWWMFLAYSFVIYKILDKHITFNFSHDNDWYAAYTELYNFCSDNNWEWSRKILGYKPNFHWNTAGLMDRDVNKVKNHTLELIYNISECIERKWLKPYLKKWKRVFYDYISPEMFNIINVPDWFENA